MFFSGVFSCSLSVHEGRYVNHYPRRPSDGYVWMQLQILLYERNTLGKQCNKRSNQEEGGKGEGNQPYGIHCGCIFCIDVEPIFWEVFGYECSRVTLKINLIKDREWIHLMRKISEETVDSHVWVLLQISQCCIQIFVSLWLKAYWIERLVLLQTHFTKIGKTTRRTHPSSTLGRATFALKNFNQEVDIFVDSGEELVWVCDERLNSKTVQHASLELETRPPEEGWKHWETQFDDGITVWRWFICLLS